ncbi:MAG: zinc-binding dehydrogenase [Deltaproteobacteria bacterium]
MTLCPAIVLDAHGSVDVLETRDIDVPSPGPGQVRVRVRAVALNHLDLWVRRGLPGLKLEYPHRLGSDIAGEVESVGAGVTNAQPGQKLLVAPGTSCGVCEACLSGDDNLCVKYRILGENTHGGYAQLLNIPAQNVLPFPSKLSFTEAAAIPLTFLTAWQMVVLRARVRPGEIVLVQGAGSGVGVAAIQIARLHGARVWAAAGSPEKCERARQLGAEEAFDHTKVDVNAEVKQRTGKRGVDVVIEHVGGDTFLKSVLATTRGGRVVTCGATSGFNVDLDLRQVFFRQVQVLGSTMGPRGTLFDIVRHVEAGRLRPVVDRVLPITQAREAHRVLEAREAFGKVVLEHAS